MALDFPSFSDSLGSHQGFTAYSQEVGKIIADTLGTKKNPFGTFDISGILKKKKRSENLYQVLGNSVNRVPYKHHKYSITEQTIRKIWMMSQDEELVFLFVVAYLSGVTALSSNPKGELFLELEGKIIPIDEARFDRDKLLKMIFELGGEVNYQAGIEDISYKRNLTDSMKVRTRTKKYPNGTRKDLITLKSPLGYLLDSYPNFFADQDMNPEITHLELSKMGNKLKLLGEEEFECNDLTTFHEMLRIYGFRSAKIKNKLRDSLKLFDGFVEFDQFVNGMPLYLEPEGNQETAFKMIEALDLFHPDMYKIIDSGTRGVHEILGFKDKLLRVGSNGMWDKEVLIAANRERVEIDNRMAQGYY